MSEDIKVSVIIPVYNTEQYLDQCIESVVNQSYGNLEVILVDDGSTDRSPSICDEYAQRDNRIYILHKANGGLSDARNAGIKIAKGDYITFLDSDDFWDDTDAVKRIVDRIMITEPDVLNTSYIKMFEKTGEKRAQFVNILPMPEECIGIQQQLYYLTSNNLYIASAWNKFIRKKLLDDSLMFEVGRLSEDIEWCARLILAAKSMDFVCESFYCYRQRDNSITHTLGRKSCIDLKDSIIKTIKCAENANDEIQSSLLRYCAYQYATFYAVQSYTDDCPNTVYDQLAGYMWIMDYSSNPKVRIVRAISRSLGFDNTCRILRIIRRIWDKLGLR